MSYDIADAVCIDFTEVRDGYDRRISSMNVIEDPLEEMVSLAIGHFRTTVVTDDQLVELAMRTYPHSIDDESAEGDDVQILQSAFLHVLRELHRAIKLNELYSADGLFPYKAFVFSTARDAITFFTTGEKAGL